MRVTIDTMTLGDVLHVAQHMRASDWAEVMNLLPTSVTTPDQIALITMQVSRLGLCAKIDGVPAIICQFAEILDGTWRVGLFGTDDFDKAALIMAGEMVGATAPYLLDDLGARYCDALSDVLHPSAGKFLNFLGFAKRAILPEYGSRGRDIALYVLTRGEANVLRNGRWRWIERAAANAAGLGGDCVTADLPQTAGEPA